MFNVENACATASTACMGAWKDVLAGTHELTFCIGIEKLFSPDAPERTAGLFNQGYITSQHDRLVEEMNRVGDMVGSKFAPGDDRLRAQFGATVDFVAGNRAIFDIGGNKYRLVVKIDYAVGLVLVRFVGVHAAYDRIDARTI